jgi:hypothetical protein
MAVTTQPLATAPPLATSPPRHLATSPRRGRRAGRRGAQVLAAQLVAFAVLLGLWEWATASNRTNAFLFGSPSAIGGFLAGMVRDGSIWTDTVITGAETLAGFALGNLPGTALGLSLWYSRFVSRVVQPFILAPDRSRSSRWLRWSHLVRHRFLLQARDVDALGRRRFIGHRL